MRCKYTNALIDRKFGIPVAYDKDAPDKPLQLSGCYGSIGILIRALCEKMVKMPDSYEYVLQNLARVGMLIGRPLILKRNEKGDLEYDKDELKKLTDLAALPAETLQINGGKLDFSEYSKKDKTWKAPEFDRYGQTEEQAKQQKEVMVRKRNEKRQMRSGKPDEDFRIFFFGTSLTGEKSEQKVFSKISDQDLLKSGFLKKQLTVNLINTGDGLKIALSGGSIHNKVASRKFYGASWKDFDVLKGEVVLIFTHRAPLAVDEYMDEDETWLDRYRNEHGVGLPGQTNIDRSVPIGEALNDLISNNQSGNGKKRKTGSETK